jgi:ferredoxin--NADP+ reductase
VTAVQIAIVGTGPAGFYVADALARKLPDARFALIDRLPTPFGLVRGGVAPDHQGTKNISRQFERTLMRDNVRLFGNVEVGRDIGYEELKAAFDVVVLCTGALADRRLDVPGEWLPGVYGSGAFVSWYNGIPDQRELDPLLDGAPVAVIGNGNVAIDIVRLLCKSPAELTGSDICAHAQARLLAARPTDVWLIGRRGPLEASFTAPELEELGALAEAAPRVDPVQLPAQVPAAWPEERRRNAESNLDILRRFASGAKSAKPVRLHLLFDAAPSAIMGDGRVAGMRIERTRQEGGRTLPTGAHFDIAVGTVITAIGYRSAPPTGVPFDEARGVVRNQEGRVEPGVYCAGWCRRGPQGVIPANRSDSLGVAELILADLGRMDASAEKPGVAQLDRLCAERGIVVVDRTGWQRINATEAARAPAGKPREKLTRIEDLLAAARADAAEGGQ